MFKLIVNGKNGKEESEFTKRSDAQAHFDLYRSRGHWGKEEQTIEHEEIVEQKEVLDDKGEVVTPAIKGVPAWTETIPAEFTYEIQDKTAEIEAEKAKRETKKVDRLSRVDQFKKIDWNTIDTIAELKGIVKALVKEAIKDEE